MDLGSVGDEKVHETDLFFVVLKGLEVEVIFHTTDHSLLPFVFQGQIVPERATQGNA
jgi:hypothetical protein